MPLQGAERDAAVVMGNDLVWPEAERLIEAGEGLLMAGRPAQCIAQVVERIAAPGGRRRGFFQGRNGLAGAARLEQQMTVGPQGVGMPGANLERGFQRGQCLVSLAEAQFRNAAEKQRIEVLRVFGQDHLTGDQRALKVAAIVLRVGLLKLIAAAHRRRSPAVVMGSG